MKRPPKRLRQRWCHVMKALLPVTDPWCKCPILTYQLEPAPKKAQKKPAKAKKAGRR